MKSNRYAIFGVLFVAFAAISVLVQLFPRDGDPMQAAKSEKAREVTAAETAPQVKADHAAGARSAAEPGRVKEDSVAQDAPEQNPAENIATEPVGSWSSEDPSGDPRPDTFADPEIGAQLQTVQGYLTSYRSAFHENPVGTNAEIVQALLGANTEKEVFLDKNTLKLNSQGELLDKWGTPYFFHQISANRTEIRSAGPDGKLWTDDDEYL